MENCCDHDRAGTIECSFGWNHFRTRPNGRRDGLAWFSPISFATPRELSRHGSHSRPRLGVLASSSIQFCRFPQWVELVAIRRVISDIHDSYCICHGPPLALEQWQFVHSHLVSRRTEYDSGKSYARQLVEFWRSDRCTNLPHHSRDICADCLRNRAIVTNSVSTISTGHRFSADRSEVSRVNDGYLTQTIFTAPAPDIPSSVAK